MSSYLVYIGGQSGLKTMEFAVLGILHGNLYSILMFPLPVLQSYKLKLKDFIGYFKIHDLQMQYWVDQPACKLLRFT